MDADAYGLGKPVVLGEYASVCGAGTSLPDLYSYAYEHGYSVSIMLCFDGQD